MDYWFGGAADTEKIENPFLVIADEEIEPWGYGGKRVVLKSDGESAMVVLKKAVASAREGGDGVGRVGGGRK